MDNEKSKLGCYGIILTCNKYHENMSVDEAKKSIKRLLSALRIRANREKWSYSIFIGFSVSNQKIKKERPHFHILLTADPGAKVARWINDYWNPPKKSRREHIGIVKRQSLNPKGVGYFRDVYIHNQSEFIREQHKGL